MSKIDPKLKKKLLKETKKPFLGLRRLLWVAFTGSGFVGLLIISGIIGGNEIQKNNLIIQLLACVLFPTLLLFDKDNEKS